MTDQVFCTIVTKSYLAYARALARSLRAHNPDALLYVLLADRVDGYFEPRDEPFNVLLLDDLAEPRDVERMSFYYTCFEFCCALRPLLHRYMLEQTDHKTWVFLDSDMFVCGSLEPVFEKLEESPLVLTPHCLGPAEDPGMVEADFIRYGTYNAGFLGLRRSSTTREFSRWWGECLRRYCLDEYPFYVDQPWLNLVPAFFPQSATIFHPGANVAFWNLHERNLTRDDAGHPMSNGQPLLFTHYSGAELDNPDRVSKRAKRFDGRVPLVWKELFISYVANLKACGLDDTQTYPYAFERFADGTPINKPMRRFYYEKCFSGEPPKGTPFLRGKEFRGELARSDGVHSLRRPYYLARRKLGNMYRRVIATAGRLK